MDNPKPLKRRDFLQHVSQAGTVMAGSTLTASTRAQTPTDPDRPLVVGVMGLSRGRALARLFAQQDGVTVKYVCDPDRKRADACAAAMRQQVTTPCEAIGDFRRILDDHDVDALVCAAPNHWHGPATILACQAGKHVYVEKPCSHNPWEGEAMVAAARQHGRVVQMGTQRRSSTGWRAAVARLHRGDIGRVYLARAWYHSTRGSIGQGKPTAVPAHLDYALWQGPAPAKPYVDNVVHYNWHWRWHWGNGELGNNGVHTIDLCRWGLGATHPSRVVSSGGRYAFDDDQETPDTHTVGFEFPEGKAITWQGLSCNRHGGGFVTFHGTEGSMDVDAAGNFRIFDARDALQDEHRGSNDGSTDHIANFVKAVRHGMPERLHAEILDGHQSTLLCHLGNIAHRTGRSLQCDPSNGQILDDREAMQHWRREYAPQWEPKV